MSKSAIYVANSNVQSVNAGGMIDLGSIIRRFGCNCNLVGNGISLNGQGYYKCTATFTFAPTTAVLTGVTAYKDGVAIPGATASETPTANSAVSVTIPFIVRNTCCETGSVLTFVLNGSPSSIINTAITVEKL